MSDIVARPTAGLIDAVIVIDREVAELNAEVQKLEMERAEHRARQQRGDAS